MTLSLQVIQFMTLMGAGVRRYPPVAARPLCWVKRTWLRDQQQGPLRTQAKQAGPNAWSRSRLPTGQTLGRSDSSMDSMRVEIMHVWNTPGKGSFLRECVVNKSSPIDHGYIITAKCVSA